MPQVRNLEDALAEELKDIYHAEKQLLKALPRMAKKASNPQLKEAFELHAKQTEEQIKRLEQVFEALGKPARAKKCEAMAGIVEEGKNVMEEMKGSPALDAGMIGAAQKAEHYEIASYGTVCTWAKQLGQNEALQLLKQNLAEEKETDEKLSKLAETSVNLEAEEGED